MRGSAAWRSPLSWPLPSPGMAQGGRRSASLDCARFVRIPQRLWRPRPSSPCLSPSWRARPNSDGTDGLYVLLTSAQEVRLEAMGDAGVEGMGLVHGAWTEGCAARRRSSRQDGDAGSATSGGRNPAERGLGAEASAGRGCLVVAKRAAKCDPARNGPGRTSLHRGDTAMTRRDRAGLRAGEVGVGLGGGGAAGMGHERPPFLRKASATAAHRCGSTPPFGSRRPGRSPRPDGSAGERSWAEQASPG